MFLTSSLHHHIFITLQQPHKNYHGLTGTLRRSACIIRVTARFFRFEIYISFFEFNEIAHWFQDEVQLQKVQQGKFVNQVTKHQTLNVSVYIFVA